MVDSFDFQEAMPISLNSEASGHSQAMEKPDSIPTEEQDFLEPSRVQFVERTFGDLLGVRGGCEDLARWIHVRLFRDGASIETVRLELNRRMRKTRLIAVASGKGGVGKTTFSVNLAVAFAQRGLATLLLDADLGMANSHIFAGVNPAATLLDVVDRRARMEDVIVPGPGGIRMICGASGVGRLANLGAPALDSLGRDLQRVAADFDIVAMDTGAGISNAVMQFVGMAHDAIVVATPNLASILDAYGIIKMVHENLSATRIHVVVNQAGDEAEANRVQERIARCAERFLGGASLGNLGGLLRDPSVEHANQSRRPLLLDQPEHPNSRRIRWIAARFREAALLGTSFQTAVA